MPANLFDLAAVAFSTFTGVPFDHNYEARINVSAADTEAGRAAFVKDVRHTIREVCGSKKDIARSSARRNEFYACKDELAISPNASPELTALFFETVKNY